MLSVLDLLNVDYQSHKYKIYYIRSFQSQDIRPLKRHNANKNIEPDHLRQIHTYTVKDISTTH